MLNDTVLCEEELFHTPSGVAFADFVTEGHRETWPIGSKRFRTWLRRRLPRDRVRDERGGHPVSARSARSPRAI
jgi:hypothetical protein